MESGTRPRVTDGQLFIISTERASMAAGAWTALAGSAARLDEGPPIGSALSHSAEISTMLVHSSQASAQLHRDALANLLPERTKNFAFHRQHVATVAQSHKRAAEWHAVHCALHFDETVRAKEGRRLGPHDTHPAPRARAALKCGGERYSEGAGDADSARTRRGPLP